MKPEGVYGEFDQVITGIYIASRIDEVVRPNFPS
jgi:hypothetical protein